MQSVRLADAAQLMSIHRDTARRWFDKGTLTGHRLPSGERRIDLDSIERVLNLNNAPTPLDGNAPEGPAR